MKVRIGREELLTGLQRVQGVVEKRNTMPILSNILLEVKRARVSKLANMKLKTLLHMAAMSCIRAKGDLKEYYIRKVKEGKNKMLILNNVRNKLIETMFAVIKRQSGYVENYFDVDPC